jgi:hypothetical protein
VHPKYIPKPFVDARKDPRKYRSYLDTLVPFDGQFNVGWEERPGNEVIQIVQRKLKLLDEEEVFAIRPAEQPFKRFTPLPMMVSAPLLIN